MSHPPESSEDIAEQSTSGDKSALPTPLFFQVGDIVEHVAEGIEDYDVNLVHDIFRVLSLKPDDSVSLENIRNGARKVLPAETLLKAAESGEASEVRTDITDEESSWISYKLRAFICQLFPGRLVTLLLMFLLFTLTCFIYFLIFAYEYRATELYKFGETSSDQQFVVYVATKSLTVTGCTGESVGTLSELSLSKCYYSDAVGQLRFSQTPTTWVAEIIQSTVCLDQSAAILPIYKAALSNETFTFINGSAVGLQASLCIYYENQRPQWPVPLCALRGDAADPLPVKVCENLIPPFFNKRLCNPIQLLSIGAVLLFVVMISAIFGGCAAYFKYQFKLYDLLDRLFFPDSLVVDSDGVTHSLITLDELKNINHSAGISGVGCSFREVYCPIKSEGPPIVGGLCPIEHTAFRIKNLNLTIQPGTFTAVLGPSGSGKSSTISVLTDQARKYKGAVTLNGRDITFISDLQRYIGLVPQDDILPYSVTVKEHLMTAARIKLGCFSPLKVNRIVNYWMSAENLNIVVSTDRLVSEVSGGQRKRINVGTELVASSPLLLLDEPTSGLDSTTSMQLMRQIGGIVERTGLTAAAVIHQPSPELFFLFPEVILMGSKGRKIYCGKNGSTIMRNFFSQLGYDDPDPNRNLADFFMDIAANHTNEVMQRLHFYEASTGSSLEEDVQSPTFEIDATLKEDLIKVVDEEALQNYPRVPIRFVEPEASDMPCEEDLRHLGRHTNLHPFLQCIILFQRAVMQTYGRNINGVLSDMGQAALAALSLVGTFVWFQHYQAKDADAIDACTYIGGSYWDCALPTKNNYLFLCYLTMVSVSLMGCASALKIFTRDVHERVFWRECRGGMHPLAYFVAKDLSNFLLNLLIPLVYLLFFFILIKLDGNFLVTFLILVALHFAGSGIGYIVSITLDAGKAVLVGLVVVLTFNFFSGVLPSYRDFEDDDQGWPITYIISGVFARYASESLMVSQLCPLYNDDTESVRATWHEYKFSDQLYIDLVFIGLFGILCRFVAFFLLYAKIDETYPIQKWLMKTYWSYHLKTKSVLSSSYRNQRKLLYEQRKAVSPHKSLDDSGDRASHLRGSSRYAPLSQEQIAVLRGDGCAQSERRRRMLTKDAVTSLEAASSGANPMADSPKLSLAFQRRVSSKWLFRARRNINAQKYSVDALKKLVKNYNRGQEVPPDFLTGRHIVYHLTSLDFEREFGIPLATFLTYPDAKRTFELQSHSLATKDRIRRRASAKVQNVNLAQD